MTDDDPLPPMTPEKALAISRAYKALADNLAGAGVVDQARQAEHETHRWRAYAAKLASKPPGEDAP